MNVDPLLAHLDGVKHLPDRKGLRRWMAKCPAHDDKKPTLSVAEAPNGTILLRCWAGCSALEIVHAMGLELSDLFPDRDLRDLSKQERADVRMFGKRNDVEACAYTLEMESHVMLQCALAMQAGKRLSKATLARLVQAYNRVADARAPLRRKHGTYPV